MDGEFGSYLYRLRQRRGHSQAALAKAADISSGYLSELENSKRRPPSQRVVDQLATALALSTHECQQLQCLAAAERAATTSGPLPHKLIQLIQALHAAAPKLPERTIDKLIHTLGEAQM
jgi:transcriptional regulator with XRE-family HTH domain